MVWAGEVHMLNLAERVWDLWVVLARADIHALRKGRRAWMLVRRELALL